MAARSTTFTVTTTATKITVGTDTDPNPDYRDVLVKNTGSVTVYVGGSDVTTANGFPLAVGEGLEVGKTGPRDLPFTVVASGTCTLAVLEIGV